MIRYGRAWWPDHIMSSSILTSSSMCSPWYTFTPLTWGALSPRSNLHPRARPRQPRQPRPRGRPPARSREGRCAAASSAAARSGSHGSRFSPLSPNVRCSDALSESSCLRWQPNLTGEL